MNPIEVTTEYTYTAYKKFYYFNTYRRLTGAKILWIVLGVMVFAAVAMMLLAMAMTKDFSSISFIVIYAIFSFFHLVFIPRLAYKGLVASRGLTENYRFTENDLEITGHAVGMQTSQKIMLAITHSAYETKDYFYVYLAKNQACIIDKSKMQSSDVIALAGLLSGKLGVRFKKR